MEIQTALPNAASTKYSERRCLHFPKFAFVTERHQHRTLRLSKFKTVGLTDTDVGILHDKEEHLLLKSLLKSTLKAVIQLRPIGFGIHCFCSLLCKLCYYVKFSADVTV